MRVKVFKEQSDSDAKTRYKIFKSDNAAEFPLAYYEQKVRLQSQALVNACNKGNYRQARQDQISDYL